MHQKITDRFIAAYQSGDSYPPDSRTVIHDTELKGFCLVVQPTGVMTFILRYRRPVDSARRDYVIGRTTSIGAAVARKEAKRRSGQVSTGIDIQQARIDERAKAERDRIQTLKVFFEEKYLPYCEHEMRNGQSQIAQIRRHFVNRWPKKPLKDINPFLVQNWRREKLKAGRRPAGVNRPVSALKAMLNRAVEWDVLEFNPLGQLKPLQEDSGGYVRFLTDHEENRLRAALDAREQQLRSERNSHNKWLEERGRQLMPEITVDQFADYLKPMVLLALNTGMRRGELFNLVITDVQLRHGSEGRVVIRGEGAKSGNTRIIPLTDEARDVLDRWLRQVLPRDLVFPSPVTNQRLDNIKRSWSTVVGLASLEGFRFHDLRHSFASKLAMKGVDLYTIKEFLGHASIETTQRYAHLAPDHKTRAISLLN